MSVTDKRVLLKKVKRAVEVAMNRNRAIGEYRTFGYEGGTFLPYEEGVRLDQQIERQKRALTVATARLDALSA